NSCPAAQATRGAVGSNATAPAPCNGRGSTSWGLRSVPSACIGTAPSAPAATVAAVPAPPAPETLQAASVHAMAPASSRWTDAARTPDHDVRTGLMPRSLPDRFPASRLLADSHAVPDTLEARAAMDIDEIARVAGTETRMVFDMRPVRIPPAPAPGQPVVLGYLAVPRPVAVVGPGGLSLRGADDDVGAKPVVVPGVSAACTGDTVSRLGAALRIQRVLLG